MVDKSLLSKKQINNQRVAMCFFYFMQIPFCSLFLRCVRRGERRKINVDVTYHCGQGQNPSMMRTNEKKQSTITTRFCYRSTYKLYLTVDVITFWCVTYRTWQEEFCKKKNKSILYSYYSMKAICLSRTCWNRRWITSFWW